MSAASVDVPDVDQHTWKGLMAQPIGILVALGALVLWLATADLTEVEAVTLNPSDLWGYTVEHLWLTLVATVVVLVVAIPWGVLLTRGPMRRLTGPVVAVANIGRAAPAVGLIVLFAFGLGFGFAAAVAALIVYAVLPVLKNTMVGLDGVDARLVEAGRGMGMSAASVLLRVELPLAVPVMLAGVRSALILVALLALTIDRLGRVVEHVARPKGL